MQKVIASAVPPLGGFDPVSYGGERGGAVTYIDDYLWVFLGAYALAPFLVVVSAFLYRGWCTPEGQTTKLVLIAVCAVPGWCIVLSCFACSRRRATHTMENFFANLGLAKAVKAAGAENGGSERGDDGGGGASIEAV